MNVAREGIPRLTIAFSTIAIAVGPARIVIAVAPVPLGSLPFVARTAARRPCAIVVAVARARSRLAPAVITIAVS